LLRAIPKEIVAKGSPVYWPFEVEDPTTALRAEEIDPELIVLHAGLDGVGALRQ
jgi:hypothetical protein